MVFLEAASLGDQLLDHECSCLGWRIKIKATAISFPAATAASHCSFFLRRFTFVHCQSLKERSSRDEDKLF